MALNLKSAESHPDGMTPTRCLVICKKSANKRFVLLHGGSSCSCFEELPLDDLIPLPSSDCEFPCSGDSDQFCGGLLSTNVLAYVTGCEDGWIRFGDSCYQVK
jgi:hypothetical protein